MTEGQAQGALEALHVAATRALDDATAWYRVGVDPAVLASLRRMVAASAPGGELEQRMAWAARGYADGGVTYGWPKWIGDLEVYASELALSHGEVGPSSIIGRLSGAAGATVADVGELAQDVGGLLSSRLVWLGGGALLAAVAYLRFAR